MRRITGRGSWKRKRLYIAGNLIALLMILIGLSSPSPGSSPAGLEPSSLRLVRFMPLDDLQPDGPGDLEGLAWNPAADAFVALGSAEGGRGWKALQVSRFEDPLAATHLDIDRINPRTLVFDPERGRISVLDDRDGLIQFGLDSDLVVAPGDMSRGGGVRALRHARGLTVDPDSGTIFALDGLRPRLIRIEPLDDGAGMRETFRTGSHSTFPLRGEGLAGATGLAFNPEDSRLYTIADNGGTLIAVSREGEFAGSWDLRTLGITDPRGVVAAPNGDPTDAVTRRSLYILDAGRGRSGAIAEVSLVPGVDASARATAPGGTNVVNETATLVRTIHTSQFSPPSPDPAGVAFIGSTGRLLVSDSEVNEMSIFAGKNLFDVRLSGSLFGSTNTLAFSTEPTGLAWNPNNGRLFVSDDDARRVWEVAPGGDGLYGTSDDAVTSINTRDFDSQDPEGVAYDPVLNHLFIIDGVGNEVYRVRPGPNGLFDGTDDVVSHFDTASLGMVDPEGITYNPINGTLFVGDKDSDTVIETTLGGSLLRVIDVTDADASGVAGVEYARSSASASQWSLWIVDRGVDNDSNSSENDGKLYEMSLPGEIPASNQPPNVDAGPNQTVALAGGANLDGTVSDDGLPNPPGAVTTTWSRVSGPGNVTFGSEFSVDTTATFSAIGTYLLRLTANDGAAASTDDVTIEVLESSGDYVLQRTVISSTDDAEEKPSGSMSLTSSDLELVYDGGNQTVGIRFQNITIPQGATVVNAYIQFTVDEEESENTPLLIQGQNVNSAAAFTSTSFNISSRSRTGASVPWNPAAWTTVGSAGSAQRTPNIASIINAIVNRTGWASGNALAIIITGSGERTAESYDGESDKAAMLYVSYNTGAPPPNTPPSVSAGPNLTITLPANATLDGTVSDDGYPIPPGAVTTMWTKDSGPGTVTFGNENAVDTTAGFSTDGAYVLTLTADDGAGPVFSTTAVTVNPPAATNMPPVVSAGPDLDVMMPATASLSGSVTDDGLLQPWSGGWSKVSGPGNVSFFSPGNPSTTAGFTAPGGYVLRLTAFDGQHTRTDDVNVAVSSEGGAAIILERRIGASSDDAEEKSGGSVSLTSSDLELTEDGSAQTVGMRFLDITIPRGSTILDAWLQFTVDEATSVTTNLLIQGQAADSPSSFSGADGNISSRARTANSVAWSPPSWPTVGASGGAQRAVGLRNVIQEIISRQGWSSGNPIVLIITGTGERVAESFEGSSGAAALLHIEYDTEPAGNLPPQVSASGPVTVVLPSDAQLQGTASDDGLPNPPGTISPTWSRESGPGTVGFSDPNSMNPTATFDTPGTYVLKFEAFDGELTSSATTSIEVLAEGISQTIELSVSSSSDDAEQRPSGSVNLTSSDLDMVADSGDQTIGLRFTNVTIPQGAAITAAWIQFTSDEIQNGPMNLFIHAQDADNPPTFTSASGNISSRPTTDIAVPWSPASWDAIRVAGPAQKTVDFKDALQPVVLRSGWASGNAVVILVTGSGLRTARSYDKNAGEAPRLHIEYQ